MISAEGLRGQSAVAMRRALVIAAAAAAAGVVGLPV